MDLKERIIEIEKLMNEPNFWIDKDLAQQIVKEYQELKADLEGVDKYDKGNAVITVFAGAGGDDAEDFARMLVEMYFKFADNSGFKIYLLHQNQNDHGGYRNITFEIEGSGVYGILKNESGVHRLVRISPFNAKKQRHTSFALVEVIPKFNKPKQLNIPDEELKVEFSRSSGPGGQNVNKRETAVRLTHLPTSLTVHCDSERTQQLNRDRALTILEAKLYKKLEDDRIKKEAGMYVSKTTEIEWGNQIRSYVLHPYKMVKDHRTGVETTNIENVLNGDLEDFLLAEKNI